MSSGVLSSYENNVDARSNVDSVLRSDNDVNKFCCCVNLFPYSEVV